MLLLPMLQRLHAARDLRQVLHVGMHDMISLLGAERGNIQLLGRNGELVLVAQYGLSRHFLRAFRRVASTSTTVCGRAAASRQPVFVPDLSDDPPFAPHLSITRGEGITSVLSCPLLAAEQRWIGMVSAHFARRAQPTALEQESAHAYAQALARAVDELLPGQGRVECVETLAEGLMEQTRSPPAVTS